MQPKDLATDRLLTELAVSPDGLSVAVVERRVVAGRERHRLLVVPTTGGRPRILTTEASAPSFSPSGSSIAYLHKNQVHVRPSSGGPARRVTAFKRGVVEYAWLDDTRFAVLAPDDESSVMRGDVARVIRRLDWREEGHGLRLYPTHVHVVGDEVRRLTSGDWWASCLRVHGEKIGFIADPEGDDRDPNPQVHEVTLSGELTQRTHLRGSVLRFTYTEEGEVVAVAPPVRRPTDWDPETVWHESSPLTLHLDRFTGQAPTTDERLTVICDNGREYGYDLRTGTYLTDPATDPVVHALAEGGGVICAIASFGGAARPDLYRLDPLTRLMPSGSIWLSEHPAPVHREVEIDGIQVFLTAPPGTDLDADPDTARNLPTVLALHGGPAWAWPVAPDSDALLLASAGYLVVRPNIRGSFHRGHAWGTALSADWGGPDADDCHTVLDHLVAEGLADAGRLACYGNSYGGFLVNWLIGTSDRFAAAISQNGVTNQVSGFAACDLGAVYDVDSDLGETWSEEGVNHLWKISPLRNVARIETPLLLLQGEQDLRCPPSDAEQMFVALRRLGKEVDYILYPDSGHSLTHDARLDRRIDRSERMLHWLNRHLG
ncbi:S9 family peptidase [Herbidospora mongoliensis]|uniref:S9 family peptidase n=1 Tax=Herbidospora mongoliensis TaxID=688067 RepID=UPI00082B0E84|nr:prolyl oligopeptidase family serine peptidase [Herbidospora mongoliensis]